MTPAERALMRKCLGLDEENGSPRRNSATIRNDSRDICVAWDLVDAGLMSSQCSAQSTRFYVTPAGRLALEEHEKQEATK